MSRVHACPVCRAPGVPSRYAACRRCWASVPGRIQARLLATWPRRVREPAAYCEALAGLLVWAREAGLGAASLPTPSLTWRTVGARAGAVNPR